MAGNPVRKAPYKDFLQPALHRRFSSTAAVLLAVSYVEALVLAPWSSYLWSWFPLGPAGVRTAFIFACGLAILILRIAHYHVGLRTSGPAWKTLSTSLATVQAAETIFWYGASSFLFTLVFLPSMPESANLQWITYFSGDRARLNERTLFLASYLGICAVFQTLNHFVRDTDRLVLGLSEAGGEVSKDSGSSASSFKVVLSKLAPVLVNSTQSALICVLPAYVVYYGLLRSIVWSWTLMFFRPFYNLPKTSMLPPAKPLDLFLAARCFYAGVLLFFVWQSGNAAFSVFMVKAPLKGGQPLTFESKDPNGSLLNGLKSKKLPIKSFAMWELARLSEESAARRVGIFQDIDRKDGPMWSQVYAICMEAVKSIETRVDDYGKVAAPAPPPPPEEPKQRVSAPLRDDPIFSSKSGPRGGFEKVTGPSPMSKLSPIAKRTWNEAKDRVLSKEQQQVVSKDHLESQAEHMWLNFMNLDYIGFMFRREFRTEFAAAVLGTPYAEPTLSVNAIISLCQLAANSLTEDEFGNVHRDVPSIIRTLTSVVKKVEALKERFPVHWTDVKAVKECPEVDQVLDAARAGLNQVVARFEPYSSDLRLSLTDLRLAKEAAAPTVVEPPKPKRKTVQMEEPKEVKKVEPKEINRSEPRRVQRRENRRREMEEVR